MEWRRVAAVAGLALAAGCGSEHVGNTFDDYCHSEYTTIAEAPTRPALKRELLHEVDSRVRSLRFIDEDPRDDKVGVNVLNSRHRTVLSLDLWQRRNGTWTAAQWGQCTD